MEWLPAMLVIFPFMVGSTQRLSVWLTLFCAGLIEGMGNADSFWLFALVDAVAGAAVMWRARNIAQRSIALIFAAMLCIHSGTLARILVSGHADLYAYASLQRALGWGQLFILALWGGADAVRYGIVRLLHFRRNFHHAGGVR